MTEKRNPKVAVIVPTFNRANFLATSLDSVIRQSLPPSQVMVVDDGSTDNTPDVVAQFGSAVHYIRKENAGKPAAINYALPHIAADIEYLWIFDDDDIACSDTIKRHTEVLNAKPDIGFTYSGSYYATSAPTDSPYVSVHRANPVRPFSDEESFMELLMSSYTGSPAVMVRMSLMRKVGGYREDMIRSQDYEIGLRWLKEQPASRLESSMPTFFRRHHEGLRGDGSSRFDSSQMKKKWREYERKIFSENLIPLEDYHFLPRSRWHKPVDESDQYICLVRQFCFYLDKGLYPQLSAVADLLAKAEPQPLSELEQDYLRRAAVNAYHFRDENPGGWSALLRQLSEKGHTGIRQTMARGIYYSAPKSLLWAPARLLTIIKLYWGL